MPDIEYFNEFKRVTQNQIIWGGNYFDFIGPVHKTPRRTEIDAWIASHPTGWIVWDKCNSDSSFNDYELAWTSYQWPTMVYKFMWNGMLHGAGLWNGHVMKGNKKLNQKRIHPTEKPFEIYQFSNFITKPKRILSNFVGSGSDRIVAHNMGIDFFGCELDVVHFANQEKRYNLLKLQTKLF